MADPCPDTPHKILAHIAARIAAIQVDLTVLRQKTEQEIQQLENTSGPRERHNGEDAPCRVLP
jgi:hypothetical protein